LAVEHTSIAYLLVYDGTSKRDAMVSHPTQATDRRTSGTPPWTLPASLRRALVNLAPAVCPPDALSPDLIERIVDHASASIGALGRPQRAALVAGIRAYDLGALARHGARSHKLDPARALGWFERWLGTPGPTHELARTIKGLLCMAYYEMPEVMDAIDYHPDAWLAQVDARRRARYSAELERHAQALYAADPLRPVAAPAPLPAPLPARPEPEPEPKPEDIR
jgi:hypothetical protein